MRVTLSAMLQRRPRPPHTLGVLTAALLLLGETVFAVLLSAIVPAHSLSVMYLPGVLAVAFLWGLWPGIAVAVASTLAFDYFLIPPSWTFRPSKIEDLAVLALFLTIALLTCVLSELGRWLAVEIDTRTEAEFSAELARAMLRAPNLKTALSTAAPRLARTLGLPSASIVLGSVAFPRGQEAFPLRNDVTLGTLLVPTGLTRSKYQHLRDHVAPALEVLLQAAQERERIANDLKASRARVATAADEERRRIGRDLHDGAQQRLIAVCLQIEHITATVPPEMGELVKPLSDTARAVQGAIVDLQEIARGLYPAVLARGGLTAALKSLARRSPVAVQLNVDVRDRLSERIEANLYYIVAEALTNVAKHARARSVQVDLTQTESLIQLAIRDDGIGGVDPSRGSGLMGLIDRVEALDGTIEIIGSAGAGTTLLVEIPSTTPMGRRRPGR